MEQLSRPIGRPSSLTQEHIDAGKYYLVQGYLDKSEVVPSVAGLACFLGKGRRQIYDWGAQNGEFLHILEGIKVAQENILITGGLRGEFNPTITKLMLTKHGYSDKVETDVKSSDGSMTPQPAITRDVFIDIARELLDNV